jgi:vesicular inhibitory amino acid transporter
MSEDKDYMSEPFIVKKIDDEESLLDDYNPQGNTSFSKTCFHGINALSGLISSSSSFFFFLFSFS